MSEQPDPLSTTLDEVRSHMVAQSKLIDDFVAWGEWANAEIERLEAEVACFEPTKTRVAEQARIIAERDAEIKRLREQAAVLTPESIGMVRVEPGVHVKRSDWWRFPDE